MKYAIQLDTLESAYEEPLLLSNNSLVKMLIVKLGTLLSRVSALYTKGIRYYAMQIESDDSLETSVWLQSNARDNYLAARVSPRTWRRHSALISMLKEQQRGN